MTVTPRYGSDLIVDLLVEAGIEHAALNPGASFAAIQDSLVHHRPDAPELVLCAHEGIAVAAAQAYAKAAGRPMAALIHDVVGLQHASMAIYNAWCDRAPVLLLGGTGPRSKARRRPWIDWIHTAGDQAGLVRDYLKWDDEPHDADSVTESFARGWRAATADPPGPVYLCYDVGLQEGELPDGFEREPLARYPGAEPPAPSEADLDWACEVLRGAELPVIVAGHVGGTDSEMEELVELAELLAAPVLDTGVRLAFPTRHELNATGLEGILDEADAVLTLDLEDPRGTLGEPVLAGATVIETGLSHLRLRGWAHDYQPLAPSARHLTATAGATVSGLLERLRRGAPERVLAAVGAGPSPPLEASVGETEPGAEATAERRRRLAERIAAGRSEWRDRAAAATAEGAVPPERLTYELGRRLEGERFVLASGTNGRLEHRTWSLERPRQYLGWHGGGGLGYGLGAAIGASLAAGPETISVDVQADGDLLFTPSGLWTIAHLRLPVLVVVANNRQYANTVEHAARLARARGRPRKGRHAGASLAEPPVDLAAMARSFGLWAAGPVADPEGLDGALAEAIEVVRGGGAALVDVLTPQL